MPIDALPNNVKDLTRALLLEGPLLDELPVVKERLVCKSQHRRLGVLVIFRVIRMLSTEQDDWRFVVAVCSAEALGVVCDSWASVAVVGAAAPWTCEGEASGVGIGN